MVFRSEYENVSTVSSPSTTWCSAAPPSAARRLR